MISAAHAIGPWGMAARMALGLRPVLAGGRRQGALGRRAAPNAAKEDNCAR
jgi:hypothetical protein